MKAAVRIFVDTDVLVSSLLSSKGAAFYLLHKDSLDRWISSVSEQEAHRVAKQLNIATKQMNNLIKDNLHVIPLSSPSEQIKTKYKDYVSDINDAHIVAGVKQAGARFLVSYNIRHFRADRLRDDFHIILLTPAFLLQYLRSMGG